MEAPTKPDIFAFSLGHAWERSILDDVHSHLMHALAAKSNFRQATDTQEALELLEENAQPQGVFITDPGIVAPGNDAVSAKLTE